MITSQQPRVSIPGVLFLFPLVLGLSGCLPVRIGNPERSRLDPAMTGIWIARYPNDDPSVVFFEPYDKRTWLVTAVGINSQEDCEPPVGYTKLVAWAEVQQCANSESAIIYKAWRSKQGKRWFLTMQPMAMADPIADDPFNEGFWLVYRIDQTDTEGFKLLPIDDEFDGFEGIPETRRHYERVIRKHVENNDMYGSPASYIQVKKEHMQLFIDFVEVPILSVH